MTPKTLRDHGCRATVGAGVAGWAGCRRCWVGRVPDGAGWAGARAVSSGRLPGRWVAAAQTRGRPRRGRVTTRGPVVRVHRARGAGERSRAAGGGRALVVVDDGA